MTADDVVDPDDRLINTSEINEVMEFTKRHNLPMSVLRNILKDKFEVNDLAKLRVGYVGMLKAQVEEAGNG